MKNRFASLLLGSACLCAGTAALAEESAPGAVQPFKATYTVVWHGMNAGTMKFELARTTDDNYTYTSRAQARGLFRTFFREEITQTSWFHIGADGVRPLRYRADDGTEDKERDIALDFDWRSGRVTGVAEEKPVDLELVPGAQDAMSMQVAHMHDLLRGVAVSSYPMVDKDRIKEYHYTLEGRARVKTALGEVDTEIWKLSREGSSRVTRAWHAPALGYVPVRAERLREGKREWMMEIRSLER